MDNIRESIQKFIYDGGPAVMTTQSTVSGVLFTDENEFIPFDDLGLSRQLGYYRLSQFPDETNECSNENPETVHPYDAGPGDDWGAFVWIDGSYTAHMLGEVWQVADLYKALGEFLKHGKLEDEAIGDNHHVWGKDLSIAQSAKFAHDCFPEKFPDNDALAARIRQACQRGAIEGAYHGPTGRWLIPQADLWRWMNDDEAHKTGPKSGMEDLITSDASTIQHTLASMYRENTGNIPRGQLWQPCEKRGCDSEPVCMNCMLCEEKHCRCFD